MHSGDIDDDWEVDAMDPASVSQAEIKDSLSKIQSEFKSNPTQEEAEDRLEQTAELTSSATALQRNHPNLDGLEGLIEDIRILNHSIQEQYTALMKEKARQVREEEQRQRHKLYSDSRKAEEHGDFTYSNADDNKLGGRRRSTRRSRSKKSRKRRVKKAHKKTRKMVRKKSRRTTARRSNRRRA